LSSTSYDTREIPKKQRWGKNALENICNGFPLEFLFPFVYLRPNKSGKGGKNWLPDRQTHYDTGD
jgi:hypothetical protein